MFAPLLVSLAAATTTLWTFMVVSKMFYNGTLRELPVKIKRTLWRSSATATTTATANGNSSENANGAGEKEKRQRTLRNRINLARSHDRWRFAHRISAKTLFEDLYGSGREKKKTRASATATAMATAVEVDSVDGVVDLYMVQPPPVPPRVTSAKSPTELVDVMDNLQEEGPIDSHGHDENEGPEQVLELHYNYE